VLRLELFLNVFLLCRGKEKRNLFKVLFRF